jgi:hypothetical protein
MLKEFWNYLGRDLNQEIAILLLEAGLQASKTCWLA